MENFYKIALFFAIFVAAGSAVGYFFGYAVGFNKEYSVTVEEINELNPLRLNNSYYKFIDPILAYSTPSASQVAQFKDLKNAISDLITKEKQNGLTKASVYTQELNKGDWIDVNGNYVYPPASMYKVVVMIAYFSAQENNNPELFNEQFVYTKGIDDQVKSSGFGFLHVGTSYGVSDLINKMIIDSDNGAELLLESHIDPNSLNSFFSVLNINGMSPNRYFVISPKQYSLFYRILYNATYLNADLSEKALDILSQTTFNDGLVAGVPKNMVVSHKFGQQVIQGENLLHDCGIIYYPKNPYFLCVMTEGNNFGELKSVIKNISSLVYQNAAK